MKVSSLSLKIIIAVIILAAVFLGIMLWQKSSRSFSLEKVKKQVENYTKYQALPEEIAKVKKGEGGFLYFYAADGKRYVFPTTDVYTSWFGDYSPDSLIFEDLETMYKTPLGGNVNFRPGTLLKSLTIPKTFIVVKNGTIRPFSNDGLIDLIYGHGWQKQVYELPDYYFSQYQESDPIASLEEFPQIPIEITIDMDKGFK